MRPGHPGLAPLGIPEGLETRIGDGGIDLSSGQKQLLAFARVLARNPRILILDEATSSVDSATEILIDRAIATTLANRTGIVIAHRLSTIRRADHIMVMDKGRIVEQGNHQSFLFGEEVDAFFNVSFPACPVLG